MGYNPLAFVRFEERHGRRVPNGQDIQSIAAALCPSHMSREPFWEEAAANYLATYIAYVLEELPKSEQTLASVVTLTQHLGDGKTEKLLAELGELDPDSYAYSLYRQMSYAKDADRTDACIKLFVATALRCMGFDSVLGLFENPRQLDIAELGRRKIALFVTVSDVDFSLAPLTNLFLTQAFQALVDEASTRPSGTLAVPVRFFLDDFSNLYVPNFEKILAVTRSREIWVTILCQAITQITDVYGGPVMQSIVSNCATQLVLAFQDEATARYFSIFANKEASTLLRTPRDRSWLFVSGKAGECVEHYELEDHPLYAEAAAEEGRQAPEMASQEADAEAYDAEALVALL